MESKRLSVEAAGRTFEIGGSVVGPAAFLVPLVFLPRVITAPLPGQWPR